MRGKVDQDATKCIAGDTVIASSNGSVVKSVGAASIVKEIKILMTGTIRLVFTHISTATTGYMFVCKNGSTLSPLIEPVTSSTVYTVDLQVSSGDLIQLQVCESIAGNTITVSNFSVKFNLSQYATVNL